MSRATQHITKYQRTKQRKERLNQEKQESELFKDFCRRRWLLKEIIVGGDYHRRRLSSKEIDRRRLVEGDCCQTSSFTKDTTIEGYFCCRVSWKWAGSEMLVLRKSDMSLARMRCSIDNRTRSVSSEIWKYNVGSWDLKNCTIFNACLKKRCCKLNCTSIIWRLSWIFVGGIRLIL